MKVVKLVLIFLAITCAILLFINWPDIPGPEVHNEDDGFAQEDILDIKVECEKIRLAWERCNGWDETVYGDLRSDIDQSKKMRLFSREGYNIVNNCLRETSINKVCDAYHSEIGNLTSFSHKNVVQCYNHVQKLMELEQLDKTLERINEVLALHNYYSEVKKFTDSSHRIIPKFKTETTEWVSFASIKQSVLNKGNRLLQDPLYSKVSHIPGFEEGLSPKFLNKATEKWRSSFYEELCSQIIAHFKTLEPTVDRVNLLNQIYSNFGDQAGKSGLDRLATFVVSYEQALANKENENNNESVNF